MTQYTDYTKGFFTFKVSEQFHDTYIKVISFMLIRKVWFSVC